MLSDLFSISEAGQSYDETGALYEGRVLLRLVHADGLSVVMPHFLFAEIDNQWVFFQPAFFGSNSFIKLDEDEFYGCFSLDVRATKSNYAIRLIIKFNSAGYIRTDASGAQLYDCSFYGPVDLIKNSGGLCDFTPDNQALIRVQHFTTEDTINKILNSAHLRGSPWNLQGVREVNNATFCYFTSLKSITSSNDLQRIAMSPTEQINFMTTSSNGEPEQILRMKVYREITTNRTHALTFKVPISIITPQPVWFHRPFSDFAYYEIVCPEVFRVGLIQGENLSFNEHRIIDVDEDILWRPSFVVLGDASNLEGVRAPFDEENTHQVFHIENLSDGM
ncbi:MAG: hypothetical protein R3D86_00005, partial [Emcibacteraceae bacterium]